MVTLVELVLSRFDDEEDFSLSRDPRSCEECWSWCEDLFDLDEDDLEDLGDLLLDLERDLLGV